jgi:hypothetical protein
MQWNHLRNRNRNLKHQNRAELRSIKFSKKIYSMIIISATIIRITKKISFENSLDLSVTSFH